MSFRLCLALLCAAQPGTFAAAAEPLVPVGAARIDITPELPIRLSGYASRKADAERIESRLFARALAIGAGPRTVVIVSVENARVSDELSTELAAALQTGYGIERARVAVCATHIHTGPVTAQSPAFAATRRNPPMENRTAAERYTEILRKKLEMVARQALDNRRPARLAWGQGAVGFATNRRRIVDRKWVGFGPATNAPADRSLPVLRATDEQGKLCAVVAGYACHCTTLMEKHNFVHSDWAGDASGRLENEFPGVVAMIVLGCAGDADPYPRGSLEAVAQHGSAVATEVRRLVNLPLQSVGPLTAARYHEIDLAFEHQMTRDDFVTRSTRGSTGAKLNAQRWIERIDSGEAVPTGIKLPVQAWCFGPDLTMVFLGGEVSSGYSLRLKHELDASRLWVSAYANHMPTYIPSKRMWDEGGYEVDLVTEAAGYPDRLARDTEDRVIEAVRALLPPTDFSS